MTERTLEEVDADIKRRVEMLPKMSSKEFNMKWRFSYHNGMGMIDKKLLRNSDELDNDCVGLDKDNTLIAEDQKNLIYGYEWIDNGQKNYYTFVI